MSDLTERQREILNVIRRAVRSQGYPPTVREIAVEVGLSSPASVHGQLAALERKGYLRRDPDKRRALEVVETKRTRTSGRTARSSGGPTLPLVGRVAAGGPVLADENIEEYLPVPAFMGPEQDSFLLRVKGDSMLGAGILDGDVVVVRRQDWADNGDIVVALVADDEATLKRFYRESDRVRLQPENDRYEPIFVREVQIVGRVTGVMRRL